MRLSDVWQQRLAVVGAVSCAVVAAKALRLCLFWADLCLGPVRVKSFKGDYALITGGSEGIGKACAARLVKHGINVVLVSRSTAKLAAAQKELQAACPAVEVRTIAADLAAPGASRTVMQKLGSTPISLIIASVGGGVTGPKLYMDYSDQEEAATRALNGPASYGLIKALLPGMVARGKGAIVAVSSIMAHWGAFAVPYSYEKAGLNAMMAALDSELHGTGVTAQSLVLGPVDTPGLRGLVTQKQQQPGGAAAAGAGDARAAAVQKLGGSLPSADAVANAMVRAIGKGGGVCTPYPGHFLMEFFWLEAWWPPSLQRAVSRMMSRRFKAVWEAVGAEA